MKKKELTKLSERTLRLFSQYIEVANFVLESTKDATNEGPARIGTMDVHGSIDFLKTSHSELFWLVAFLAAKGGVK